MSQKDSSVLSSEELEIYLKSIDMYQEARQTHWTRVRMFLTVQALLFTAFSLSRQGQLFAGVIALAGISLSIIWRRLIKRSFEILDIWEEVALNVEIELSIEESFRLLGEYRVYSFQRGHFTPTPDPQESILPREEGWTPVATGAIWALVLLSVVSDLIGSSTEMINGF